MDDKIVRHKKIRPFLSKRWWEIKFEDIKRFDTLSPKEPKKPYSCDLLISEKCNLKCLKCHFWKSDVDESVSPDKIREIIDSLARIGARPFEINFGGGEPLLFDGITDVIKYAAKKGLQPALSTNATLIDKRMAKKLASSGLNRLSISLDSLNENTHDKMVGVKGAYKRLMKGLENLSFYWKRGDLNIHTLLSGINYSDVADIIKWADKTDFIKGVNIQAVSQPFRSDPVDKWYERDEYKFLWPDSETAVAVIDEIAALKKSGSKVINPLHQFKVYRVYYQYPERFARKFRCNAGDHTININAMSLMHLCCFMKPLGSLKLSSVEELWFSPQAEKTRYAMYNCRKSCNNILNCFFEEEDIEAGFKDDISVKVSAGNPSISKEGENIVIDKVGFINLNVTPECTLPCKTCYTWKRVKNEGLENYWNFGLKLAHWRYLIDEAKEFCDGETRMFFGGGEPLCKRGIFNLINVASGKGYFTMLGTSAYNATKDMAFEAANSGLRFLNLSLDSHNGKRHDYLKGKRGVWNRAVKFAENVKKYNKNIDIGIATLISAVNLPDIAGLLDFVEKSEIFSSIYFQAIVQPYDTEPCNYWYRLKEYKFLWPDYTELEKAVDLIISRKRAGMMKIGNSVKQLEIYKLYYNAPEKFNLEKVCRRDKNYISINWMGYVSLCDYLGPIGNVKDFSLRELLSSKLAGIRVKEMENCNLRCNFIENVDVKTLNLPGTRCRT